MNVRHPRLVLAGISAAAFLGPFTQTVYAPSLVEIGLFFGVDTLRVNLTISLFVAIIALSGFIVGPLADRHGRRALLLPGLALFIAGSLLCLLARRYDLFLAGRAIQAAGVSVGVAMAPVVIGDLYDPQQRARAMSLVQLITFLGPVAGPLTGGLMAAALPWQWVFALLAGAGALVLAANARWLPETLPAGTVPTRPSLAGYREVLGDRSARSILLLGGAQFYGYYTFLVFLPVLLGALYGMPVAQRGLAFVPLTAGVLAGIVVHRRIEPRWTRSRIVDAASFACVGVVLALWALLALDRLALLALLLLMLAYGVLVGVSLPAQTTILVNLFGARRGTAVGLYTTLRFGGAALGPLVAAWVADTIDRPTVFLVLALALAVAATWVRRGLVDPFEVPAPKA